MSSSAGFFLGNPGRRTFDGAFMPDPDDTQPDGDADTIPWLNPAHEVPPPKEEQH